MPTRAAASDGTGETAALLAAQQLYETTREICGRLDIEEALQAIVRRANRLLNGELAYLATCDDEHRVLRMRAFDNVKSESFRALVIPYDVGLAGAVASQRKAIAVSDYFAAPAIQHSEKVDASAKDEGIRSGIACPVQFESRLLAVLFVSKRITYKFSQQQMTMLSSLANIAAIAINNAEIHGKLVAAMRVHKDLMDVVLEDQGPATLLGRLTELIRGPATFVDWRGVVIADQAYNERQLSPSEIETAGDITRIPIRIGGIVEGHLLAAPDGADTELALVAIEQATTVLALELMKLRHAEQVELRLHGGVFNELMNHPVADEGRLLRQAQQLGCDLRNPHVVVVLQFSEPPQSGSLSLPLHRLAQIMGRALKQTGIHVLVADQGDVIVMLVESSVDGARSAIEGGLVQARRDSLPKVVVGVGTTVNTLDGYRRSFEEASRAVQVAQHATTSEGVVCFEELGFHHVLLGAHPPDDLYAMANRSLAPLLASDRKRGTDLITTVRSYLEANGNVEAVGRQLGLHPNTVRGRLLRINELLGREITDSNARLDLHLALEVVTLAAEQP